MAPLSKLTLTSYQRTQPNRDPVEERRSKTLAALAQLVCTQTVHVNTGFIYKWPNSTV